MTTCNQEHHAQHNHTHGKNCGHIAVRHDGHVDYLHDGHLHHVHGEHVDEHAIEVNAVTPDQCTHGTTGPDHVHRPGCGHPEIPHGDHIDYLVNGRMHHMHGDHCDDHGPVQLV